MGRRGRLDRLRPHIAACAALLLVLGVARIGGVDRGRLTVASARPDATDSSGGLDLDALEGAASGPAGPAAGPGGTAPAGPAPGGGPAAPGGGPVAGPTGGPRGGAAPVYDPGVSDREIRVGGSTFTSGPAAVYGEQIAVGFAAGVNQVNAEGGVNGRRLTLVLYDDGADPAKQLANTKRLVEIDKVFALSMVYADAVGEYVASKGIPVVHLGQNDAEFTNPWWFPVGGPQRLASYSLANYGARELGVRSVAVFYLDAGVANYSRAYAEEVASDWKAYGVEVPVLAPFAPDQTSCSDAIGKAREANVDFIQFEIDAGKVINCGVEAQIQGYKPPKSWGGYLIGVPVIHEALGDYSKGMYAFDAFAANYDSPTYQEAVRAVSSKTQTYSSVTMSYYIAAQLLRDGLSAIGDEVTRVRLRDALNGLRDWTPGITDDPNQPTWTWTPECHVALRGGYVIQIQEVGGELKWKQVTPQFESTPLPPGVSPPARFASCDIFRPA